MSGAGPSASGEQAESESPWLLDDHTVSNTPSRGWFQQKCGGDELAARRKEDEYRKLTCAFIQDTGRALRMPQLTIASAMVFYHRFFAFKSYEHFDRFNIATTALFLASKTEETPRKLKDVVAEAFKCQYKGAPPPEAESRELHERKEKVLIAERILLQTLGFDLSLEHPYRPLLAYVKSIKGSRDLAQVAWNYINDSLRTQVCLQFSPRNVAAAALKMAADHLKKKNDVECPLPNLHTSFSVTEDGVDKTSRLMLQLYPDKDGGPSGSGGCASGALPAHGSAPPSAPASPGAARGRAARLSR